MLGPAETETVREVKLGSESKEDRLLQAVEFRPGSANVVRSALLFLVLEGQSPAPENLVASWVAGESVEVLPDDNAVRFPAGASVWVRIHYKKTWLDDGKEVSDRSQVALTFRKKKRAGDTLSSLVMAVEGDEPVRVEGADFETSKVLTLTEAVEVRALLPRVESRLSSLLAEAVLPDGETRTLIRLREPSPDWPRTFWLQEPLSLPKASRIRVTLASADEESLKAPHAFLLDVVPE